MVDHSERLARLVIIEGAVVAHCATTSLLLLHLTVVKTFLSCHLLEILFVLGCQAADKIG